MKETNIQRLIMMALSKSGARIFRNNVGKAYAGKAIKLTNGDVVIKNPYLIKFGLCVGSSDVIGWTPVTITPDMVGQKVAIFTAIEVKKPKGRVSPEQKQFIERLTSDGGLAGVARSEHEAVEIIRL